MKKATQRVVLYSTLTVLSAAGLYGCKDFLTAASSPQGTLNQATLTDPTGVEGSLIAAYRTLDCTDSDNGNWGCAASNWVWGSVISDDAYKGSEQGDQGEITDLELFHWSTANSESYLDVKWKAMYEGVNRANATIRLLKDVEKATPNALTAADQKGIEGEATFLRAHYHFEAWELWGNIPYYRETDTDFRKPSEASDAVVADIEKDLQTAISLLPATPRKGEVGRATSWTAKAFLGRVQVYAGQYAQGLQTLRDVQANGPYALETSFDHVWSGFKQYENGKETILAFQASVSDGDPNASNSNYGERLNFPYSGSHFACCSFHQPSQTLVNHFRVDANGLPLALSDPTWNNHEGTFDATASANVAVDPRLDWTVGRYGTPYKDWGPPDPTWVRNEGYSGPYLPKKNIHEKASGAEATVGWQPQQQNSVNIHIFRYADLLLLLAEAEVEAGSLDNARKIVNQIRQRAAVAVQGPGTSASDMAVSINDPRITWAKYKIGTYDSPWTNQQQARDAVREERNLELAMEGHRFFDLRRWKIADQVMNAYVAKEASRRSYYTGAEPFTARHQLFPIPNIEIQLSKVSGAETLKQNTGW